MKDIAISPDTFAATSAMANESEWPLQYITLAGLSWPGEAQAQTTKTPVIMLHGWLDNSLTFTGIAPELTSLAPLHAVDLAGHGHSGHRPLGQNYQLMDYVADVAELIEEHFSGAEQVDIVGHSLGGIVGALYAAAFPDRIRRLVMIDSLGALSGSAEQTVPQLRKYIKKRMSGSGRSAVYPDVVAAAKVREGGLSPLSHEAALTLIPRNLKPDSGGFIWRTDARLRHPSPLMMTEAQIQSTLEGVQVPTLLVRAEDGLLKNRQGMESRVRAISSLQIANVPGGHHCHLDGDIRPVADAVRNFLEKE